MCPRGNNRQSLEVNVDDFSFVGSRRDQTGSTGATSAASQADDVANTTTADEIDEPIDLSDIPF